MYCTNSSCRKWNDDKATFCKYCGTKLIQEEKPKNETAQTNNVSYKSEQEPTNAPEKVQQVIYVNQAFDVNSIPAEYRPIGMGDILAMRFYLAYRC